MHWPIRSITGMVLLALTAGTAAAALIANSQGWIGAAEPSVASAAQIATPNDRVAEAFAALDMARSR
jgi:hypothetical protein